MDGGHGVTVIDVIRGHCSPGHLPDRRYRTVRVYVSSTPDMWTETDAIQRIVHPKLRKYCAGKYGIDFKFVELHWGVEESTGYLNSDLDLMRKEITSCRTKSIGPAFLCLIGHKLGTAFLPLEIQGPDYQVIADLMEKCGDGSARLLERFYHRNDQDLHDADRPPDQPPPVVYRLQHEQTYGSDRKTTTRRDERMGDLTSFKRIFRSCIHEAAEEGLFTETTKKQYTPTVFETEVDAGLKDAGDSVRGTAICFIRTMRDIDFHLEDPQYVRYSDVIDGVEDEESQSRLLNIREIEVRQMLPVANLKQVTSEWDSVVPTVHRLSEEFRMAKFAQKMMRGGNLRLLKHEEYLEDFCNMVLDQLKQLIDNAAAPLVTGKQTAIEEVYEEVIQHWRKVQELVDCDMTEEEAVSQVTKYLTGDKPFACIIHGSDALVRSRVFARATAAPEVLGMKAFKVIRIISTFQTHDLTLSYLLWSLCRQIYCIYQKEWVEPTGLDQLKRDFERCLTDFPTEINQLYLQLDGMELIGIPDDELEFSWIPANLSQHVKIVVTCSNSSEDVLQGLSSKTPYEELIINLDGDDCSDCNISDAERPDISIRTELDFTELSSQDSEILLDTNSGLSDGNQNRVIEPEAHDIPNDIEGPSIEKNSQLSEILRKELYTRGIELVNSSDISVMTQIWMDYLQERHGKPMLASVFRFLSLANRGLTESELLDLLSLDEELLNEGVFLGVQPSLRRFPELLWTRLRHDLEPILQVLDRDNRDVLSWVVPEIKELTRDTFLNSINPASKMHHQIALYFMGIAARPKPIDDCHSSASSYGGPISEPEIRVNLQPSIFENPDLANNRVNYNLRKLSELPHHLLYGEQIQELKKHILFNYRWLYNKLNATSPTELISVVSRISQSTALEEDSDVKKLLQTLEDSFQFIQEIPMCLRSELTGRLLPSLGQSTSITALVRQCDDEGYIHCPITPLKAAFDDRKDEVKQIIPCDTGFYEELYVTSVPGRNQVITYTVPDKICLWDTSTTEQVMHYQCDQYTYCTELRVSQNGMNLLALNNGRPKQSFLENSPILDIYDIESGKRLHRIHFFKTNHKLKRLFRVFGLGELRILFDTHTYVAICVDVVRLCNVRTGQEVCKIPWPFLVTPDENFLVMTEHDGQRLIIRSFPDLHRAGRFTSPKNITAMVAMVSEVSLGLLVASGSSGILNMYSLDETETIKSEPFKQGILVEKKDITMKGGCGSLVLSKDNSLVLAIYIHASGREIHRTNFVVSTETLENVHIYESGVKDQVEFSPDGKFLVHLKMKTGVIDIIEITSGDVITTYQTKGHIRQISPMLGTDDNILFVVTKDELQTIFLDSVIEKARKELADTDSDSDSVSVEYNTPRTRLRTLHADVPLSVSMSSDSVQSIPVQLTLINEESGEVKSNNLNLVQGIHFDESELPSYLSEAKVTPDGTKILIIFEQLFIIGGARKGERKVLSGPLKDDFSHTKVTGGMTGMGIGRDVFGVGTNSLSQGTPLQKGSKIYGNSDTRRGTIFEAEGGETIQRCPSVIRVYSGESGSCLQAIPVKNEKLLTCNNGHVVTSSSDGNFTNIYTLSTGQLISTLDCAPSSAVFTIDDKCLIIVPQMRSSILNIYSGTSYLTPRRCDLADGDIVIWEVFTCPRVPTSVLVSLLGQRAGQEDSESINYAWIEMTYGSVTRTFTCQSELVQLSSDGATGVDSEFRFYNLKEGIMLFQIPIENVTLAEHSSFITDDGDLMVFLDNESGKINIIDIQKKRLLSQSFFHPIRSRVDTLRGHHEMASLIPLHGGLQAVLIDGMSVKHFLLQTLKRQVVAMSMVKLRKRGFDSPDARTHYYHSVNADGNNPLTRRTNHRIMHRGFGARMIHAHGKRK